MSDEDKKPDGNIIEAHGYFWWHDEPIPTKHFAPDSCVVGLLTISKNGRITLELHGVFPSKGGPLARFADAGQLKKTARQIQGLLKDSNQHVLLSDIYVNGGRFTSNGISYDNYTAYDCLISNRSFPLAGADMRCTSLVAD